nr:reverse transcriptase domain-containing protein [Tanacetum cinerariifolium]
MKVLQRMESIRCHFLSGADLSGKQSIWVKWNSVLASKEKGRLGVLSLYALNRALMFKWIWRFFTHSSSLWAWVIKAIHSEGGKIGKYSEAAYPSLWLDIVHEMELFKKKDIDIFSWVDVAAKLAHTRLVSSFRREPRGGVEHSQLIDLLAMVEGVVLVDMWKGGCGHWRVRVNPRWRRLNISRRGMDIDSIICPICDNAVESSRHIFFNCNVAREILRKIARWWDVSYMEASSYEEWLDWISNLRLSNKHKQLLEGRNLKIQEVSQHYESRTPNVRGEHGRGRRSGCSRSMSGSPEPTSVFFRIRRGRSDSPRHRLGVKEERKEARQGSPKCMRISGFMHGITNPELIERLQDKILKSVDEMMREILALDKGKFKAPPPMSTRAEKRNNNKFCEFHGEVGDNTNECMHLKRKIEELIKARKLSRVIKELKQGSGKEQPKAAKKGEAFIKNKDMAILMVQWQRVARQRVTQSFSPDPEISLPPLGDEDGTEGPMIIEAEIEGHFIHRIYRRNRMANGTNITTGKIKGCGTFNLYMDEIYGGKITISIQWDHMKAKSKENSSSPVNGSRNVKISSPRRNTLAMKQQDYPTRMHNGLETRSTTFFQHSGHRGKNQSGNSPGIPRANNSNWLHSNGRVTKGIVWRMRVDFKDLNKACPKDGNLLPEIDWKVESLCGYPFKCFLDAYKGYDQIKMKKKDEEKITFITSQRIFCYSKMPFGLKNAGETYQLLVDKAFQKQIGRNLEVYVDDLVIKSHTKQEIIRDIEETFKTLRKINTKLNPKKCTFGVEEDFIVKRPEDNSLAASMEVEEELLDPWTLFINRSSFVDGSGARLILTNPEVTEFTYALRFRFNATNNEAEYKALIASLIIAEKIGVKNLQKHMDSRPVANQINRSKNKKADTLSKIMSTNFAHLTKKVLVEELNKKSINEAEVLAMVKEEGNTWMTSIYEYLTDETLHAERKKERAVRIKLRRPLRGKKGNKHQFASKKQAKMEKYYNSKFRNTSFKPRDLVYRSNDVSHAEDRGKLGPKLKGPYEVTEALGKEAYKLRDRNGKLFLRTWNVRNLKKCYVHEM